MAKVNHLLKKKKKMQPYQWPHIILFHFKFSIYI